MISETNLYEPRHKARLAIKPGITGMWQVSGRSDMTESLLDTNLDKFVLFMKGAIALGFFQMQMNLIDSKTLIDAKAHPENTDPTRIPYWRYL